MEFKRLTITRENAAGWLEKWEPLIVIMVIAAYIGLAGILANVKPPHADEGHFGNAAYLFESKTILAMPMWNQVWLPTLDKHMYVTTPLYFIGLASWFRLFGVGLVTARLFSVLWGAVGVLAWYVIAKAISKDRLTALLSLVLIALSYDYINLTSGRYDGMAASLGAAGLAAYMYLREKDFHLALLVSNVLVAASFMTHPYGLFSFVGLSIFVAIFDLKRLGWRELTLSAVPYVAALASWGLYISRDIEAFKIQFFANAAGRISLLSSPLSAIGTELKERYIHQFAGFRTDVPVYGQLKILVLLVFLLGLLGCLGTREIRRVKEYRTLIALTGIWFLMLTYLEGTRRYNYFIWIVPIYWLLTAIWLRSLIRRRATPLLLTMGAVSCLIIFSLGIVAYRLKIDSYKFAFVPALQFLQEHANGELIIAPGEFGFGLGFEKQVLDDASLGYRSGISPMYIVIDKERQAEIDRTKQVRPEVYEFTQFLLEKQYRVVFHTRVGSDFYDIYGRMANR